jgi:hypothetical protein
VTTRNLLIWFFVAAFVFNGAASRAWIDLPAALGSAGQIYQDISATVHTPQAGHDAHTAAMDCGTAAALADDDTTHVDDCLKCCSMCIVTTVAPDATGSLVPVSYAAIAYPVRQGALVGHLVALDPDIPKSIV